jgi:broad specificity phosphatase PhoE
VRLLLIRHGQTSANVAGELDTAPPGAELTALGRRQAAAVAEVLTEPVRAVHASPLVRTQQSAEPLARARGLTVDVRPGLEEVWAGDLEMASDRESVETYLGTLGAWMRGDLDRRMPGGHDGHAFVERYDAAVRGICQGHGEDDAVAVFSHGAAIRSYTGIRASGPAIDEIVERRIMNTGLIVLDGDPGSGWRVVRWTSEPLGGPDLVDGAAHDITGDGADEALAEAD